jgi:hypothetical protein
LRDGSGDAVSADDVLIGLDSACATAFAKAHPQPVYMLIALDGSGSMTKDSKWAAVVPALDAFFDALAQKADTAFGVGLTVFSDSNDPTCQGTVCNGPYNVMQVPVRFVDSLHAQALHARLDTTSPMDGTPTYSVLHGEYPVFEAYSPPGPLQPNGRKVLVLMTDGVPNGGTGEQQLCIGLAETEFNIVTPPKGPITTFAVGVGIYEPLDQTNYDPVFMGHLAVAGGAPNPGCDPNNVSDPTQMCHFQITPGGGKTALQLEQDFLDAINKIRGDISSCNFLLEKTDGGGPIDPALVNVIFDDGSGAQTLIPQDKLNGWTYDDFKNPTRVILHGTMCDTVKNDPNGSVDILLGCKTVVK